MGGQAGLQAAEGGFPRNLQPYPCSLLGATGGCTTQELASPHCLETLHCSMGLVDLS